MEHELDGETLYATDGGFLAATPGVDIDSEFGGLKSLLGEASPTPLVLTGSGTAFVTASGGLRRLELGAGESYALDDQHLVAWDDRVDFETRRVGGLKSTLPGGEGLVLEFHRPRDGVVSDATPARPSPPSNPDSRTEPIPDPGV